jgi:DNA uptake protein ComE-like DNA-binding protein
MDAMSTDAELERVRGWWVLLAAIPLGFGAGPAFLYAAARARVRSWAVWGVLWAAVCLVGLAVGMGFEEDSSPSNFGDLLMVISWIGGFGHALGIRRQYVRRVRARGTSEIEAARARLRVRDEARRIAREEPRLALEMGIGRPDRRGAHHGGLIDVNHAPARTLERLPGVDGDLARRIAAVREEIDGFASLEDMGSVLDIDAGTIEDLRERAVFLPR